MTTTDPRRTEYLPLSTLKPDPANPKSHDMEALDASVGRFGFVEGITLDERTGYIVAGHGRHKALTDMEARGETPPEGVTVSEDGDWLVPVQRGWSSRTDAEARAYLIASNRTSELGGWVDDSLLSALDELDGDFTGVGFGEDDLDDLRAKLEEVGEVIVDTPSGMKDDAEHDPRQKDTDDYVNEGRRLVIMDYSVSEYPLIQARLKALRTQMDVDNNAEALSSLLADRFPGVSAEEADDDSDPLDEALGVETFGDDDTD